MMIPTDRITPHVRGCGAVIHAGAHVGQEASQYAAWGIADVLWIEANPALIDELSANVEPFGHRVVNACLGATAGDAVTLHVADEANGHNHGQSSSVLELGTHATSHPEVFYHDHVPMITTTVDDIVGEHVPGWFDRDDVLYNTDLQGLDLDVMFGASRTLTAARCVIAEINVDALYRGCGLWSAMAPFLYDRRFEVQEVMLAGCQMRDCADGGNRWVGWGDVVARRVPNPRPFPELFAELWASWHP